MTNKPLILITNDDGVDSPGLLAAAEAAAPLGDLLIMAPHQQQTGAGRSFGRITDRNVYQKTIIVADKPITAYSVKATPAQAVAAAFLDFAHRPIDLTISGINFGENIGSGITISGTVGAALEAATKGPPALAVSLETPVAYHHSYSTDIDFSAATYFTRLFAQKVLAATPLPFDVNVLKIDVPANATPETPWRIVPVSRQSYHIGIPSPPENRGLSIDPGYITQIEKESLEPDSDTWAVCVDKVVAISPLSFDLTSRTNLSNLEAQLNNNNL